MYLTSRCITGELGKISNSNRKLQRWDCHYPSRDNYIRKSEKPFQLIILDVNMPDMDGFELVKIIREQEAYSHVVIMILTSSGLRGDAARCRELEIAAYLSKLLENIYRIECNYLK